MRNGLRRTCRPVRTLCPKLHLTTMSNHRRTCPQNRGQILDTYFLEHRAKLLDVAAFLDRLDRASDAPDSPADFRETAFRAAIGIVSNEQSGRVARVLQLLSDHTSELPESADGMKGASGAPSVLTSTHQD